ncbi:hypothetical protein Tco_0909288 [Tanacetum coccineum]|uniref:Uncharacterized protein n=1 Tax=Tanacetum coccineum TaxID=301880 RepID=A0ABQ5CRP1_9ASTR
MEALTRIDSQLKEIKGVMKEMRDGCNKCGGPHPSSDCSYKPMGVPKEEEANYDSEGYREDITEIIMVASDDLRDALSVIIGLSELKVSS